MCSVCVLWNTWLQYKSCTCVPTSAWKRFLQCIKLAYTLCKVSFYVLHSRHVSGENTLKYTIPRLHVYLEFYRGGVTEHHACVTTILHFLAILHSRHASRLKNFIWKYLILRLHIYLELCGLWTWVFIYNIGTNNWRNNFFIPQYFIFQAPLLYIFVTFLYHISFLTLSCSY